MTWTHGAHNVKTGASLIRRQLNLQQSISARGSYSVNGTFTGSALGDLVAGYASDAQFQNDVAFPRFRSWEVGGFIQDDWRVTKWLALNLGVRYEIFTPFTEVRGYISNFDTATGYVVSPILSGANHGSSTANVKTDWRRHLSPARLFGIAGPRHGAARRLWPLLLPERNWQRCPDAKFAFGRQPGLRRRLRLSRRSVRARLPGPAVWGLLWREGFGRPQSIPPVRIIRMRRWERGWRRERKLTP